MKKFTTLLCIAMMSLSLLTGCSKAPAAPAQTQPVTENQTEAATEKATEKVTEAATEKQTEAATEAATEPAETKEPIILEDGIYTVDFVTDSAMFHVNEALEGKGTLTVADGKMTVHVSLASDKILNLYPGLAEDAAKDGAELLQPTKDTVTYSDGESEEVNGFDIPVPAVGVDFDCALIGGKGKWYDHVVSVQNPEVKAE